MAARKFTLNDSESHVNRWNSLIDLWREGKGCDVEIICSNNEKIIAHKVVLLCSGFDVEIQNNKGKLVIDIPMQILKKLIDYCYYGKLEIEATELDGFMRVFALLKAKRLFEAVEDYFAENIEAVPQSEFNKMSITCLRSLSSKCLQKKDFWLNVVLHWAEADESRKGTDYFVIMEQIMSGEKYNNGFDELQQTNLVLIDPLNQLVKHQSYKEGTPFYFNLPWQQQIYMYNRSRVTRAQGFPKLDDNVKDIIMINPQNRKYLQIFKNKNLTIRDGDNAHESEYKIDGYCLNPPLLVSTDGRVLKVVQCQNEQIFQEIPQLSAIIPKITANEPQCLEFVDKKVILLRDNGFASYYSKMCILSGTNANEWKDITMPNMTYLDVDDEGQLFGVRISKNNNVAQRVNIIGGGLRAGETLARMRGVTFPLPFISSWGSVISYIYGDRTFRIGIDDSTWTAIGSWER